jgi:hypothetical protein
MQGFYTELRALVPNPALLDDLIRGVEFRTAREPTRGTRLQYDVWFTVMQIQPIGRSVTIYYTFDDQRVYFHRAEERVFDQRRLIL